MVRAATPGCRGLSAFRLGWLALELSLDLLALALAAALAYALHAASAARPTPLELYLPWLLIFLLLELALFALTGMYRRAKQLLDVGDLRALLISLVVGYLTVGTLLLWMRQAASGGLAGALPELAQWHARLSGGRGPETVSRFVITAAFALAWPLCAALRVASLHLLRLLARRGLGDIPVALAGRGEGVRRLRRRLERAPLVGAHIIGCFTPRWERGMPPFLGDYDAIERVCTGRGVRILWVAWDPRTQHGAERDVGALCGQGCEVRFAIEPIPGAISRRGPAGELWLEPLGARSGALSRRLKRALDLALAPPIMLFCLPLLALLILAVRATSSGRALIRQERVGLGGRTFGMWKLRTMYPGATLQPGQRKRADDPRVTPLGRWLRRFSLDELPQLWNVLRGEMSLVGPRPELSSIVAGYDARQRERLQMPPGLTGLWQVSAARRRPIHEELDYDLYYVRNRGLWLDLTILLLTVFAVLRGSGAR